MMTMQQLAARGAAVRIKELDEERRDLVEMFPAAGAARLEPMPRALRRQPGRRRWTPQQRKDAAARMRLYWARRRKAKG